LRPGHRAAARQEGRRTEISRFEQSSVEQRPARAQPGIESGEIALGHCFERKQDSQLIITGRDKLAAGFEELLDQRLGFRSARRITTPKN
jgi:hypothetical protein